MSLWRLIISEILFRKLNFLIGVLAVVVAVGCLVGQIVLLDEHERRTEAQLAAKEQETAKNMAALEDQIRITMKNLGFNIRILPKDLDMAAFYRNEYPDTYMPEEYVERLSNAGLATINHLLPILQQRMHWPELKIDIILSGTRGEVPIATQNKKKPIQDAVPAGKIVLGYDLHRLLSRSWNKEVHLGDEVKLAGRSFTIQKLYPQRGDRDDKTAWISLKEAQEMFNKKGLINGMLVLECNCSTDRLAKIREEIAGVLPETQVEEFETKAIARAEARNQAAAEAKAALERERRLRDSMLHEKEAFAAIFVPCVLLGCAVWLGVMALINVQERRGEIGLLRAVGLNSGRLLGLFLGRAALVGFVGAVLGYIMGIIAAATMGGEPVIASRLVPQPKMLVGALVGGPLISALACWLPALIALRQDPAKILQREGT